MIGTIACIGQCHAFKQLLALDVVVRARSLVGHNFFPSVACHGPLRVQGIADSILRLVFFFVTSSFVVAMFISPSALVALAVGHRHDQLRCHCPPLDSAVRPRGMWQALALML